MAYPTFAVQPRRRAAFLVLAGLIVAAVVAAPARARAADGGGLPVKLELGLTGGAHFFANDLELGVDDDPTLPHPKTGGLFGLRASLALTSFPILALEVEGLGIPTADSKHNYRMFVVAWRAHLLAHILQGQLLQGKLVPFVLAGAGALSVVQTEGTEYDEIKKDTDAEFHAGVGVKYAVTPMIGLRLDGRALAVPNTSKNGMSADFEIMGGLFIALGGGAPAAPAPPPKAPVAAAPVDTDNDGIPDNVDTCPTEAEDKDGFKDEDGCPDPDNDKDGVADAVDKCPNEPETKNGFQDDDGCPDEVPAAVAKFTGVIKGITFRKNSADIKPSSFPTLKQAVQVMKNYPTLRIEVSGHTSDDGKRDFNMKLSQKRADAVKAYLVSAGAEPYRVTTVGYGPDKPMADNKDKAGKEKNRRIEFRLLSQDEGLEGAPAKAPEKPGAGAGAPAPGAKATEPPSAPSLDDAIVPMGEPTGAAPPPPAKAPVKKTDSATPAKKK